MLKNDYKGSFQTVCQSSDTWTHSKSMLLHLKDFISLFRHWRLLKEISLISS